jgi:hypothetical protein
LFFSSDNKRIRFKRVNYLLNLVKVSIRELNNNAYKYQRIRKNMRKLKEKITNRKVVSSLISIAILALLFLAGPVQAFILGLSVSNSTPSQGEKIVFTASIDIEKMDKYLPIKNLTLSLRGPENTFCTFDVEGKNLSACKGLISIERISSHQNNEYGYGYGYGYDSENGEGYNFGYGYSYDYGYDYGYNYGYGYDYGYGGKPLTFEYKITLDTTNYSEGKYDSFLNASIGNEKFSKKGQQITITGPFSEVSPIIDDDEEEEEEEVVTSSTQSSSFYFNPDALIEEDEEENPGETGSVEGIEGDVLPGSTVEPSGFFGRMTGAVVGALGTGGSIVALVFVVLVAGSAGFVMVKRFRK